MKALSAHTVAARIRQLIDYIEEVESHLEVDREQPSRSIFINPEAIGLTPEQAVVVDGDLEDTADVLDETGVEHGWKIRWQKANPLTADPLPAWYAVVADTLPPAEDFTKTVAAVHRAQKHSRTFILAHEVECLVCAKGVRVSTSVCYTCHGKGAMEVKLREVELGKADRVVRSEAPPAVAPTKLTAERLRQVDDEEFARQMRARRTGKLADLAIPAAEVDRSYRYLAKDMMDHWTMELVGHTLKYWGDEFRERKTATLKGRVRGTISTRRR